MLVALHIIPKNVSISSPRSTEMLSNQMYCNSAKADCITNQNQSKIHKNSIFNSTALKRSLRGSMTSNNIHASFGTKPELNSAEVTEHAVTFHYMPYCLSTRSWKQSTKKKKRKIWRSATVHTTIGAFHDPINCTCVPVYMCKPLHACKI